jgi:hypothetical protein
MKLIPKNWVKFQHYKDRNPPWIKLHRDLLIDKEFMRLPLASKALAPLLWLLASESVEGVFDADLDELEFRLRISQKELSEGIKPLITNGFFLDASTMLAVSLQDAIPETEREAERETKYTPPIPKDLLDEWMKIRRKKKAGDVTEIVYNSIKREADKAGWTVEQAITRCCERSWVGFEAEWVKSEIVKPKEVRLSL